MQYQQWFALRYVPIIRISETTNGVTPMTEDQIERKVERMIDRLDREYLSTPMSADTYKLRMKQIDEWAWMQSWTARLNRAQGEAV